MRGQWLLQAAAAPAIVAFATGCAGQTKAGVAAPVLERARLLASAPIGNGFVAHAWLGPSTRGDQCYVVSADRVRSPVRLLERDAPVCMLEGTAPVLKALPGSPLVVDLSVGSRLGERSARDWQPPVVDGVVAPNSKATRIALEWRGGSHALALENGHFIGGGPFLYKPAFERLPFFVVAYDRTGREVARSKLDDPALYLVNGWKAFSPMYRRWKQAHGLRLSAA